MALLTIHNGQLAFGDHPLLDKTDFALQENERVCLVGRNGAGKSTLMKVLAGDIIMDDGKLQITQDVVVSRLEQDPLLTTTCHALFLAFSFWFVTAAIFVITHSF